MGVCPVPIPAGGPDSASVAAPCITSGPGLLPCQGSVLLCCCCVSIHFVSCCSSLSTAVSFYRSRVSVSRSHFLNLNSISRSSSLNCFCCRDIRYRYSSFGASNFSSDTVFFVFLSSTFVVVRILASASNFGYFIGYTGTGNVFDL